MLAGPKAEAGIEHNQFLPGCTFARMPSGRTRIFPRILSGKWRFQESSRLNAPMVDLQLPIADRHTTASRASSSPANCRR